MVEAAGDRRRVRRPRTVKAVDLIAEAKPWTFWMALPLVLGSALAVLGVIVAYLLRVVAAKHPRQ